MHKSLIETLFTPQEQSELKQSMKQLILTQFEKDLAESQEYIICCEDIQEFVEECLSELKSEIKSEFKEKMRKALEEKMKEIM